MVHVKKVKGKKGRDRSGLEAKEEVTASEAEEVAEESAGGKQKASTPPTTEQKQDASKRAIEAIKKGLKENPDAQKDGRPFLAENWAKDFKLTLGPYRKFVEKCGAFVVQSTAESNHRYTIHLQDGNAPKAPSVPDTDWGRRLAKTWQDYLRTVKPEDRNPQEFVQVAKRLAYQTIGKVEGESRNQKKKRIAAEAKKAAGGAEGGEELEEPAKKKAKKAEPEPPAETKKKKKKGAA